ncbi:hypothetical protein TrCOL_g6788 [Triparma columacea]|uniref:Zn(2)-C6 fungal-type domain-containing protein n=1 Tax=Triparma columacea TaxID=722753 RepID=A0A9W7GAV2_9STRA|nr:hypothetical protein TrCOL_g6788 [Triparma columacea]
MGRKRKAPKASEDAKASKSAKTSISSNSSGSSRASKSSKASRSSKASGRSKSSKSSKTSVTSKASRSRARTTSTNYAPPASPQSIDFIHTESVDSVVFSQAWELGESVLVHWENNGYWYPGTISRINKDGTVGVDYEDGDKEKEVSLERVRKGGGVGAEGGGGKKRGGGSSKADRRKSEGSSKAERRKSEGKGRRGYLRNREDWKGEEKAAGSRLGEDRHGDVVGVLDKVRAKYQNKWYLAWAMYKLSSRGGYYVWGAIDESEWWGPVKECNIVVLTGEEKENRGTWDVWEYEDEGDEEEDDEEERAVVGETKKRRVREEVGAAAGVKKKRRVREEEGAAAGGKKKRRVREEEGAAAGGKKKRRERLGCARCRHSKNGCLQCNPNRRVRSGCSRCRNSKNGCLQCNPNHPRYVGGGGGKRTRKTAGGDCGIN